MKKSVIEKAREAWKAGKKVFYAPDGGEMLEPTPLEIPIGFQKPETLASKIKRMVQIQISESAQDAGFESIQEANDFDIPGEDDNVATSGFETTEENGENVGIEGSMTEETPIEKDTSKEEKDNSNDEKSEKETPEPEVKK